MIVKCEVDPDSKELLNLMVDGELFKQLHIKFFGSKSSIPSHIESYDVLEELLKDIEYREAKKLIIVKLARRNCPSFELADLLRHYLVSEECIDRLIHEFVIAGYVDDEEWIASVARSVVNRKKGPAAIEQKLRQLGAPEALIEKAFSLASGSEEQIDQIRKLLETRYRGRNLLDRREREKTIAALTRRGFDLSLVREAISH